MAARRLRGEFDVPVDGAVEIFTDALDELSSVRYTVEREGNAATINVGFIELATWVYPTIAALLGLVLAAFLVPNENLPTVLADVTPLFGFQRWWAVLFTIAVLVGCYLLSQVTAVIPGGEVSITPDGENASNVEVRDVSEPYMYRALRNVVNENDRHEAAARAEARANQLTLGSVLGVGALGVAGLGRRSAPQPDVETDVPPESDKVIDNKIDNEIDNEIDTETLARVESSEGESDTPGSDTAETADADRGDDSDGDRDDEPPSIVEPDR